MIKRLLLVVATGLSVLVAWGFAFPNLGRDYLGGDMVASLFGAARLAETGSPFHDLLRAGPLPERGLLHASYIYPPPVAQAHLPLLDSPLLQIAALVVPMLVATWLLPWVYAQNGGRPTGRAIVIIGLFALTFQPWQFAFYGGNLSGPVTMLVTIAMLGPHPRAGAAAVLATTAKLLPAPIAAVSLVDRRTRAATVGTTFALIGISVVLAPQAWADWIEILPNTLRTPLATSAVNYSIANAGHRVGLEAVGSAVGMLLACLIALYGLYLARRGNWRLACTAAVLSAAIFPGTSWDHYWAVSVPLVIAAWPQLGRLRRQVVAGCVLLLNCAWFPVLWPVVGLLGAPACLALAAMLLWPTRAALARAEA